MAFGDGGDPYVTTGDPYITNETLDRNPLTGEPIPALEYGDQIRPATMEELRAAEGPPNVTSPNSISGHPDPPEKIEKCEALLDDVDAPRDERQICEVVVAKARGALPPGDYSNPELDEALKDAGVRYK